MPELIIETKNLKKIYGGKAAVDGIDLAVGRGSIHGFLGRNGSGKTTTIKMLLGLTHPTSGEGRVFGLNPEDRREGVRIRQRVGFVSEDKGLYDYVKVEQMISFTRSFFPTWDREMEESQSWRPRSSAAGRWELKETVNSAATRIKECENSPCRSKCNSNAGTFLRLICDRRRW